ncbi:uncharacterized protein LOC110722805 isoform X1 [Chenopodium quinoa]|uniref:uncharacterized protein LOC110722805 isoform X1 n=2 Tax=Chenopodium quinoa TaxID=63459 RepID=UPI000B79AFE8|nr:uncharacterized protein LOC110722805 isoform X1 [Chenopodium quinoa]XP_021757796.1 uncharacterized protein LOC110722805 isoform X1 [Chenopodium quinoa]
MLWDMPMDYDDNDTSRHNLQLAGEGRSRSSTLRPYDFPKFDFDDSLQGHLRFDSLVETEVFLGIQSQEDNQWIEDFSRDSNGMEFNSTPADSCSLSRRNNVWSEATSSESVEMLLKSVGQEEMMPGASILPESDATHDQGIPSKHGETGTTLKESNDACVVNPDTALRPGDVLEDSPASERHMVRQLENPSATHAKIESACGDSSNVNQSAMCDNGRTSTNEVVHSFHDLCAGEKLKESQISVEKTMNSGAVGDSLNLVDEGNNFAPNVGILGTSKTPQQVKPNASHESCSNDGHESQISSMTALEDTAILEEKAGVARITVSNSPSLTSDSGRDYKEASHHFSRDSTNNSVKGESELKSSEGDDENSSTSNQTSRREDIFIASKEAKEPFDDQQGRSSMDFTLHPAESGSLHSGHCASTEQDMDVTVHLPHKNDNDKEIVSALPMNHESMSGMHLLSNDNNGVSVKKTDFIGEADLGNPSTVAVLSYAADLKHTEDVEGCHSECVGTGEESAAIVCSHGKDVFIQGIQDVSRQVNFSESEKDSCKTKEADKEVSTELGNIESGNAGTLNIDQRTQSLEIGEGIESNNAIHNFQPQISGEPESAKSISPLATTSALTALDDCPEIGQREPTAVGLYHSANDCEEAGTKESNDTNIGAEADSTSKVEVRVADGNSEMAAKSLQPVDKIDDVCSIEHSSAEAMNCLYSDHMQAISDSNTKSSLKESADAHLVSGENHVKAMSKEEERESAPNSEFDKTSCGSPTIISSSEPSQMEKDNHEEGRSHISDEVVKDIQSSSEDPNRKDLLVEDSSFTFKVNVLPDMTEKEPAKNWSPFPDVEKRKVVEETAPSGKGKTERTTLQKTPRHNARVSDGESGPGGSRGTSERKGRRGSAKGTAKENSKKGNQLKGPIQDNASMKTDKVSNMQLSPPISSPLAQFGQMQAYGIIEGSSKKPSGVVAVPTSSLPDLNTAALNNTTSPSASFRQSFTDMQQVQLRAQIFVYGSLIQGTAPDEACMSSAFGPTEGAHNSWEPIWRGAVERVRNQKSSSSAAETPSRSPSGPRASDGVKQGSHSSKVLATPVSRGTNKDTPAAAVSPMIPLSSPLWNISTPTRDSLMSNAMTKGPVVDFQQSVTPVHSFQTPPLRNYVGHTAWPPQTCFPAPWMASPQTAAFSSSVRFHPVTMTETVKLTPVNDTSAVLTSSAKHTTSSTAVQNVSSSPLLGGMAALQDPKIIPSAEQHIVDSKPRKRKKAPGSDPGQVSSVSEAQTGVVISDVATFPSSSIGVPPPACQPSDAILSRYVVDASRVSSIEPLKKVDGDTGKAVSCSEETLSKVAEAKSQAENAADLSAAAIRHCEDLWSQLAKKKDSGLASEAEVKLASAAVAIAAAASVAKAAAAAAKIACNAALQAKLMADEAFFSSKTGGMKPSCGKSSNDLQDIGNATPTSILKSNNVGSQSSSILLAAKEAAKKRVEAASAASRQAENLDAIVKAAELAATAVSQAGKIVAMGEPLPLNDLIEAGPEGCWKSSQPSAVLAEKVCDENAEQCGAVSLENNADVPASSPVENSIHSTEGLNGSLNVSVSSSVGIMGSKHMDKMDFRSGINRNIPEASKSGRVASEPGSLQDTTNFKNEREVGTLAGEEFKEGSSVEVFKPGNGLKSAWYSANVLSLEEGKAYVCYNDLLSEEGSGNLREWVPLESEGDKAPVIRAAHPSTALQYQQTRKRRRAALGDYAWCVGDRVDVWIDDCWWEGVVTEKNEKDETTLKIHIPAQGETSTVRAWNLRASLSWINGKWIECSSSRVQNASEQSDTPQEKRQKLEISQSTTKAKDKESNNVDSAQGKHELSKSFNFSTSERTFDIGKTTNDDSKRAARRPLRTNQQKGGSGGVVFGVPKPTGKKRKFMEVSKHFPATKSNKSIELNDSVKFTKYLVPQGAASRGWKAPSRNDSKEKRTVESKSRVPSTRKAHRTLSLKENFRSTVTRDVENSMDHGTDVEDSAGHDNTSEKLMDHGSDACEDTSEAPLSSLLPHSLSTGSKKVPSSNTKSDRLNRGKLGPSGGKLSKIEEDRAYSANTDKSNLDGSEPRRSNRRIQPTHRLLEGLQSSMVIPKMPSVSHDKGRRNLRGK